MVSVNRFDGGPLHVAPMGAMPDRPPRGASVPRTLALTGALPRPLRVRDPGFPHRAHGSDRPTFCGMVHRTMQYGNFVQHLRLMFTPSMARNIIYD